MATKIRILDELTINKMAAGEVIENPSSVVKELVENSLDAQATTITVEIQAGGRLLIRVTDDGCGMGKDDALLCLERHGTSKLRSIEDLYKLTSLGFRGEAIPSIASVAKFTLLTSESDKGTFIRVEGGKIFCCEESARAKGTTIEVKDLFFNLPVRKKFLKSPTSDENDISKVILQESLARPDVKFQLIVNQKSQMLFHPSSPLERIETALGHSYKNDLLPVNKELGPLRVVGYIGKPYSARPTRSAQYLFLNGRPIQSSYVSWAIKEAFSTHIPANRYPPFVLWLTLPPEEVDVNVHPQKKEVRFRDENEIKRLLFLATHEALAFRETEILNVQSIPTLSPLPWESNFSFHQEVPPEKPLQTTFFEKAHRDSIATSPLLQASVLSVLQGYIIVQIPSYEGISLIDQKRAHARVIYEELEKKTETKAEKEALLIPVTLELTKQESTLLKEHLQDLQLLGFEIREFGAQTFMIEAYPTYYGKKPLGELIHTFLDDFQEFRSSRSSSTTLKTQLAEKASDLSVKNQTVLSREEAERLVEDLLKCDNPWESPAGKPTIVHLDRQHLAKQFQL